MASGLSSKGQVTIPKLVREQLGLVPGTKIEFRAERGKLIGVKALVSDGIRQWRGRGRLPAGMDVDAYLDRVRGKRAHRG